MTKSYPMFLKASKLKISSRDENFLMAMPYCNTESPHVPCRDGHAGVPGSAGHPHQQFGDANLGFWQEFLAIGTPIKLGSSLLKINF